MITPENTFKKLSVSNKIRVLAIEERLRKINNEKKRIEDELRSITKKSPNL